MNRIEKITNDLVLKYKTNDPFALAELLNIDIQYWDLLDEPKGQTVRPFDKPIILLNKALKHSNERFFVCAHELGHALDHVDFSGYYISNNRVKDKYEYQADSFAKKLLIGLYKEEYGVLPHTCDELVHLYGYPKQSL